MHRVLSVSYRVLWKGSSRLHPPNRLASAAAGFTGIVSRSDTLRLYVLSDRIRDDKLKILNAYDGRLRKGCLVLDTMGNYA